MLSRKNKCHVFVSRECFGYVIALSAGILQKIIFRILVVQSPSDVYLVDITEENVNRDKFSSGHVVRAGADDGAECLDTTRLLNKKNDTFRYFTFQNLRYVPGIQCQQ